MKKRFLVLLFLPFCGFAQVKNCATDLLQERLRLAKPDRATKENQFNQQVYQALVTNTASASRVGDITIPVVVHIIHQNGDENIPDAMVLQGLQHLNEAFSNTGSYQQATGVNTHIQFCLAQQDEQAMPTTGITRHQSELTNLNYETQDAALKSIVQWDPLSYLNIYLVNEITSTSLGDGVAGYAYYPSSHGAPEDGIVNEAGLFGSSINSSKVHIHEAGHYLGLYHTFSEGCTNQNCLMDGDRVCDTPPDNSTNPVQCNLFANTCTSDSDDPTPQNPFRALSIGGQGDQPDMFVNYMDYGFQICQHSFTLGQSDRMNEMVNGPRASLLNSDGCNNACNVYASGTNADQLVLYAGNSVTLIGYSVSTVPHHFQWLQNGIPVSNDSTYFFLASSPGDYNLSFRIYNDSLDCFSEQLALVKVLCGSQQSPASASSVNPEPGETVIFSGYPAVNAISYQWQINGITMGFTPTFDYTFAEAGECTVVFITSNGICSDTSNVIYIPVGSCNKGEGLRWFFGSNTTMAFYGNTPSVGLLNTNASAWGNEGCSSICNQNGDLILFTNGQYVFNGSGNLLVNGDSLAGGASSAQGALIVPNPSYNGLYYVFTTDPFGGPVPENSQGLSYSIADINQDSITQKNVMLSASTTERQAAVKHCNGHDIWHLSHEYGTDVFYAHLVTDEGISTTPVISHAGTLIPFDETGIYAIGCMKISPQGDKLAYTIHGLFSEVFDFDNETGLVSNAIDLPADPMHNFPYGVEFSSDGSKLYISNSSSDEPDDIFQYDLSSENHAEIIASKQIIANTHAGGIGNGSLQIAKNGRIYSTRVGGDFLDEIREPNLLGTACQFTQEAVSIYFQSYPLPTQVASVAASLEPEIYGPLQICANATGIYSITCGHPGNTTWNYTGIGTFQQLNDNSAVIQAGVAAGSGQLIVTRDGGCNGLLYDTLNIRIGLPQPDIGNDTLICSTGELHLSPGQGYSSYLWQDGSNMSYYNAQGEGNYWVRVTGEGGCSSSDTIHVTSFNDPFSVSLGNDVGKCPGGVSLTLAPEGSDFTSYSWSTGETTPSISIDYYGSFTLEVTNGNGCKATDSIIVYQISAYPYFQFTDPQYLCKGQVLLLETPFPELQHRWQDNSDLPEFTAWQTGLYWVKVTSLCGPSFTDSVTVIEGAYPMVNLGEDTVACPFTPFSVGVSPEAGNQYLWSDGTVLPMHPVIASGNYILTVTNAQGCSRSDTIKVKVCPTGVGETNSGVVVYPNPASDYLRIESVNYEKINVRLFTILGQMLIEKEINGNAVISTADFAEGTHVLEITAGLSIKRYRIVVTH